jgi:protein O-mannosyl-transferase
MPKQTHRQQKINSPVPLTLSDSAPRQIWVMAAVALVTVLAYSPAITGGMLWDDDAHVTKPELRSLSGLYRIWFDPGATQQYYPLLHSVFWIEQQLWGDSTIGYHLVNIVQHLVAACLVWLILLRLKIPCALLAAAIFALHPVHVESVAWISEQKNTLSAVFYLSAMLTYLHFDETRNWRLYGLALGLFVLGLLTKTVTATLPAALLVILWWQRNSLSWRSDIRPLIPFFAMGAVAGVATAWVERKLIGAEGVEFDLSFLQRGLIAGRAIWFYVEKLFWPDNLIFVYPRWEPDPTVWWQWLFPIAALAVLVLLWTIRHRWRGPLAAWLFFVGTLFPALGFLNVYPFIYSFVADHFQYLASLGMIVLVAAGIRLAIRMWLAQSRWLGNALCVCLVGALAILTWRQSRLYSDIRTLYSTTLARNPNCWMVANNLGNLLKDAGEDQQAIKYYEQALSIKPDYADAHNGLASTLAKTGQAERALEHYKAALRLASNSYEAHNNLGNLLVNSGNLTAAIDQYRESLKWNENYALAHNGLGNALRLSGELQEAIIEFKRAIAIQPDFARAYMNLGITHFTAGNTEEGIKNLKNAVRLEPKYAEGQNNLANALVNTGRVTESFPYFEEAIRLKPDYAIAHLNLANAFVKAGRYKDAVTHYKRVLELNPDNHNVYVNLVLTYAELGLSKEAIQTAQRALEITGSSGNTTLAAQLASWLKEYRANHPDASQ